MGEKKKVPLGDPRRLKILVSFETATSKKPDRWKYKEIETSNDLVGSKSYGESRRLDAWLIFHCVADNYKIWILGTWKKLVKIFDLYGNFFW